MYITYIGSLGITIGCLTSIGALRYLIRLAKHGADVHLSFRTFALFFAINAFLFNMGLFKPHWPLFFICAIAMFLNGMVILRYMNSRLKG